MLIQRHLIGGNLGRVHNRTSFVYGHNTNFISIDTGHELAGIYFKQLGIDPVFTRHQHLKLPAFFTAVVKKSFPVQKVKVPFRFLAQQPSFRNTCSVHGGNQAHISSGYIHNPVYYHFKKHGIDAVITWSQHPDLRAFLAFISYEFLRVLVVIAIYGFGKDTATLAGFSCYGFYNAYFIFTHNYHIYYLYLEEEGIDAVLSIGQYTYLRAFLTTVPQKGFPILKIIAIHRPGEKLSGFQRLTGYSCYQAHLALVDLDEFELTCLINKGFQVTQARAKYACLNTYFIAHSNGAVIGHSAPGPAPLEHYNFIPFGINNRFEQKDNYNN